MTRYVSWSRWGLTLFPLLLLLIMTPPAPARTLVGELGDARIRLNTLTVNGNEYVNASELLDYFPGQWRYEGLTGTLIIYRTDGTRISMQAGDQRILVGNSIEPMRIPPLRSDGQFVVPFFLVITHLFPTVEFQEDSSFFLPTPTPEQEPDSGNANRFLFRTPTPLPHNARPFVFEGFKTPTPLLQPERLDEPVEERKTVVVIDPGNDGANPGAIAQNGLREYALTRALSEQLAAGLEQESGFEVILTHRGSSAVAVSNLERVAMANRANASLFLSIHCGAMFNTTVSRGGVYYMNNQIDADPPYGLFYRSANPPLWHGAYRTSTTKSYSIAQRVLDSLRMVYRDAGVIELDEAPRPGRFGVLRGLTMPGILVELGNLADPKTANYLSTEMIQQEIVNELTIVILNTLYEQAAQASGEL